ncbi:MAG TPA: hypothetical protein VMU59_11585 [Caulobacteraceae bacterium]|nr:hypothetical protein [Caulobacteraceae bacterium]
MSEWNRVKWSQARQIAQQLKWENPEACGDAAPKAYFDTLVAAGRLIEATAFLGLALPRLEAVAWAARAVRDLSQGQDRTTPEAAALKAALLWLQDPTDERRWAAWDAAEAADPTSAEALAARAVFFSGGSMAPPSVQPTPVPKDVAGVFAAVAVQAASARAPDKAQALKACLAAGDALASSGV